METMAFPEFIRSYNELFKACNQTYHRLARHYGLSDCAFSILYFLRNEGKPMTQAELCTGLFLSKQTVNSALKKLEFCYQKAGLVKYDAYNQMGGNLSFCLCMLNERNSGFILNSVHSSDGCYTYTKEIKNGECEIALGEEERKALNMAIGF